VGLDPVIGLIPFIGYLIALLVGSYIVVLASRLGVPRVVVWRMLVNLGIDFLIGLVPIVGDTLDVFWKANAMNARLLERALDDPKAAGRSSFWVLLGLLVVLLVLIVGSLALSIWLVSLIMRALR